MALSNLPVYLSTFLLERNRWNGKGPSLLVSDWVEPTAEAGFRGMEIWFPHLFFASRSEWEMIREKSQESELPIVFISTPLSTDASDKSFRQREALIEAAETFGVQGVKFTLPASAEFNEERLFFLAEWTRDLPRGVQVVPVFDGKTRTGALERCREKLGALFRCSLDPFSNDAATVEKLLRNAGDSVIDLSVKISSDEKHLSLRSMEQACADLIAVLHRSAFNGSWTLESTHGVGTPDEDMDRLFDHAEEDLNFLVAALARK